MKSLWLYTIGACIFTTSHAQHISFGVDGAVSQNTQLFYNPQKPEDGTTQLNWMTGFNAGIFARCNNIFGESRKSRTTLKTSLTYFRKGSSMPYQSMAPLYPGVVPGATQMPTINNDKARSTLDYLTLNLVFQTRLMQVGEFSLIGDAGFGNNLLLRSDIEGGKLDPIRNGYPFDIYNDHTIRRYNLAYILGLEIRSVKGYSLFIQTNQSMSPVFISGNLRVKDWSWIYGLSVDMVHYRFHKGFNPAR